MVAVLLADGEIMERGEADEIARGDRCGASDIGEIAGQLRIKRRLGVHVLPDHGDAKILRGGRDVLHAPLHPVDRPAQAQDGQMMFAKDGAARDQLVARDRYGVLDLGPRFIGSRDLTLDACDFGQNRRPIGDGKGLGDDQLALDLQQAVEHAGARPGRIFAHREHGAKARVGCDRSAHFKRLLAEGDAPRGQIAVEPHAWESHRQFHAAIEQLA